MEEGKLIGVELHKLHYLLIEADNITSAFSVFKNKLEEKEIFIDEYTNIDVLIEEQEKRKSDIAKLFIKDMKYQPLSVAWGGLYAPAKGNTLDKKFKVNNIVQNGTKKWETRYVIKGAVSNKRYDIDQTTKGEALELAKDLVIEAKEDLEVQVEKVLISHDPSVAVISYIKDETEHANIFMFLINTVTFDEEDSQNLYEDNVELDPDTKQYKIKVQTVLDYDKRIKI